MLSTGAVVLLLLETGSSAVPVAATAPSTPTAEGITIAVAPGDSVLIPYSGSDDNLFGFFRTSDLSDPSAGFLFDSCVCIGTYAGFICSCTTVFVADEGFTGSTTFTYRAVDFDGNQSADATVTINSTVQARTPGQILDEIEFIILRGTQPGGDIDVKLETPLLATIDAVRDSLAKGNFDSARGQGSALCNQIESGIATDKIRFEAAATLTSTCLELTSRLDEDVCLANVTEFTIEMLITDDWNLDLAVPGNSKGAIEVPFFTGTYKSASKDCVSETRCAGGIRLSVELHVRVSFPAIPPAVVPPPPISFNIPSFQLPSTDPDPVVHPGARQLHSHRWRTEAQSIPFALRVMQLVTLAEQVYSEGADSVSVDVLNPTASSVEVHIGVQIEVDCEGGGVSDDAKGMASGVAGAEFPPFTGLDPDEASFPCPEP